MTMEMVQVPAQRRMLLVPYNGHELQHCKTISQETQVAYRYWFIPTA
jgi:hypothetical protein